MNLPNDIRLKIEKSPDKEDILLLLARLENDGVTITNDVYAAIVATLEYTKLGAIEYDLGAAETPPSHGKFRKCRVYSCHAEIAH